LVFSSLGNLLTLIFFRFPLDSQDSIYKYKYALANLQTAILNLSNRF
jgi:hypothetical protein